MQGCADSARPTYTMWYPSQSGRTSSPPHSAQALIWGIVSHAILFIYTLCLTRKKCREAVCIVWVFRIYTSTIFQAHPSTWCNTQLKYLHCEGRATAARIMYVFRRTNKIETALRARWLDLPGSPSSIIGPYICESTEQKLFAYQKLFG